MENFNAISFLEAAYRRKWLVIAPAALGTAIAAIVAWLMPSYYLSTTLILVEQQQVPTSYVTPTDVTPFNQRLNTIRQQILSRPNLERIINEFSLYQTSGGLLERAASKAGIDMSRPLSRESALNRLVSSLEIRLVGERRAEDAFSISYSGTDPYTTMQVTSALASMFINENLKRREMYAEGTSEFLSDELARAKSELEAQERAVRDFKERYMGGLPEQLDANLRTLDRLQLDLQAVRLEIKGAEDRKVQLETQLNSPVGAVSGPQVNPLVVEMESLQRELTQLLSQYNENYPDVIIVRNRLKELGSLLASNRTGAPETTSAVLPGPEIRNPEAYNNLVSVESQLRSLRTRERELNENIRALEKRVEDTPANEQRYTDLNRNYQISFANYQNLLEKSLNARLAENLEKRQKGERFRIIDPANLPEGPYKPKRGLIALAGTVIGAGLGFGVIFLLEFTSPAFRKPEEFEGLLDFQVIASIPAFEPDPHAKKGRFGRVSGGSGKR